MIQLTKFDMAEYLDSEDMILEYLNDALKDDDPKAFLKALSTVSRARGMMELSKKTGMPRESLYQILSPKGNPSWQTLRKIATAMGFSLALTKATASA